MKKAPPPCLQTYPFCCTCTIPTGVKMLLLIRFILSCSYGSTIVQPYNYSNCKCTLLTWLFDKSLEHGSSVCCSFRINIMLLELNNYKELLWESYVSCLFSYVVRIVYNYISYVGIVFIFNWLYASYDILDLC